MKSYTTKRRAWAAMKKMNAMSDNGAYGIVEAIDGGWFGLVTSGHSIMLFGPGGNSMEACGMWPSEAGVKE